jgi:small subunit ribosomal protein S15
MSVTVERKAELVRQFGGSEQDTGRSEVQVAILTERIKELTEHSKVHVNDNNCKRGMLQLVGRRRRLLDYLAAQDMERYRKIIQELGLRR